MTMLANEIFITTATVLGHYTGQSVLMSTQQPRKKLQDFVLTNFTTNELAVATSALRVARRSKSSPQQCYQYHLDKYDSKQCDKNCTK